MVSTKSLLDQSVLLAKDLLKALAEGDEFLSVFEKAFGDRFSFSEAEVLRQQWLVGDFTGLPLITILSASSLNGANGAFSSKTGQIYLSQEFLDQNIFNPTRLTQVLLEEIGHFVDTKINLADALGDEGEIFSSFALGKNINSAQIQSLQHQDDRATVLLDGQEIQIERNGSYTGTNLDEALTGLNSLLSTLDSAVNARIYGSSLPLLGTQLQNFGSAQLFSNLSSSIQSALAQFGTSTSSAIKQALLNALGPDGQNILLDLNNNGVIGIDDIDVVEDVDDVKFNLKLRRASNDNTFSTSLGASLGLPGLGLEVSGNATASIGYSLDFKFGVNKTNGFYFDTSANNELSLNLNASLPGLNARGKLGILELDAIDQGTQLKGTFTVDLRDSDNQLRLTELSSINFADLVDAKLTGEAKVKLGLTTQFSNTSVILPSIKTNFDLVWSFNDSSISPGQVQDFGSLPTPAFNNVQLDLDSFLNDFTRPIFSQIKTIMEPIKPIIDFLVTPIDLKIAKFNLLDIAQELGYIDQEDRRFIEALQRITQLASISQFSSNLAIDLGSFNLGTADIRSSGFSLGATTASPPDIRSLGFSLGATTANPTAAAADWSKQLENAESEKSFLTQLTSLPGISFSILTDASQAFKMLLGQDANLFAYDLPNLDFTLDYEKFFPIVYALGVNIKGQLTAAIDLKFGYDTKGLKDFEGSKDIGDIFNGFYIDDSGQPQAIVSARLEAALAVDVGVGSAGAGGGILGTIGLNLKDPTPGDGKVRGKEFVQLLNDPLKMFDASGQVEAYLMAYAEAFGRTIGRVESPRVILLGPYGNVSGTPPQLKLAQQNGGELRLNMGPHAAARQLINTEDGAEEFIVTNTEGGLTVTAFRIPQQYSGVSRIIAEGGERNDTIDIKADVTASTDLNGGAGDDLIYSGSGNDTLRGGSGWDRLFGGDGDDTIYGEGDNDWLTGGAGADLLDGGAGFDTVTYNSAQSGITLSLATGSSSGDAAGDVLRSIEQIVGSPYADTIVGSLENDTIGGGDGNDSINGSAGDDVLMPDFGDDVVDGGIGTDTLVLDYSFLPTQAVAFRDFNVINNGLRFNDVYIANAYGIGVPTRLNDTNVASIYDVAISADGTTVAWTTARELWIKRINSSAPATLLFGTPGDSTVAPLISSNVSAVIKPSLSRDGSKISWTNFVDGGEIWVASTDGTGAVRLFGDDRIADSNVVLSADGSTITWEREVPENDPYVASNSEIFVANSDGTNVRRITDNLGRDRDPVISADGSKVAWQVDAFSPTGVFVANSDGSGIRELSNNTRAYNRFPSISADGSRVIWEGTTSGPGYSQTNIYGASTDGSRQWILPNSLDASSVSSYSLGGNGDRVIFERGEITPTGESISSIYVGNVDDNTQSPVLIDVANSNNASYGSGTGSPQLVISTEVNVGVRYTSFDLSTGSGEIYTWGPSRVRYSNIEQFEITGTKYGDELFGGNLADSLTGGGGSDTLKAGLGNDTYILDPSNSGGSKIQDTGGTDTLVLKTYARDARGNYVKDAQGKYSAIDVVLSLSAPTAGTIGLYREGTTLFIDLNKDGTINADTDLTVQDFFALGSIQGTGFIETIGNLTGDSILNFLANGVNDAPTVANPIADQTTPEDLLYRQTIALNTFQDLDLNDSLTYSARLANGQVLPTWLSFDPTTRTFSGTPTDSTSLDITITATDTAGASTSDSFSLTITALTPINGTSPTDSLTGTDSNDILTAANLTSPTPGRNEKDTMTGGAGRDIFVLGDQNRVFYDDISYRTPGTSDYARITDFNPSQDLIQLHGNANDYSLGTSPIATLSGTALFYTKNQQRPELIAILQGSTSPLDLTTGFKYV
jgi:hypothetical protein